MHRAPGRGSARPAAPFICAHCGQPCGDYDAGYGCIATTAGLITVCHPNVPGRPDCLRRIEVFSEPLGVLRNVDPKPAGISAIGGGG